MKNNFVNFVVGLVIAAIMGVPLYFLGRLVLPFTKDVPYLPYATEAIVGLMTIVVVGCITALCYFLTQMMIIIVEVSRRAADRKRKIVKKHINEATKPTGQQCDGW